MYLDWLNFVLPKLWVLSTFSFPSFLTHTSISWLMIAIYALVEVFLLKASTFIFAFTFEYLLRAGVLKSMFSEDDRESVIE